MTPTIVGSVVLGRPVESAVRFLAVRRPQTSFLLSLNGWRWPCLIHHALRSIGARRDYPTGRGPQLLRQVGLSELIRAQPLRPDAVLPDVDFRYLGIDNRGAEMVIIRIDHDYFTNLTHVEPLSSCSPGGAAVMPYFAHPDMLQLIDRRIVVNERGARPIRIGFAGSHSSQYRRIEGFNVLDRTTIIDHLLQSRGDWIADAGILQLSSPDGKIVLAFSPSGPSKNPTHSYRGDDYLDFLASADFAVSAPGLDMPHSHNLVEAMSQGTIPILNYANWLSPRLVHGVNCLEYRTLDELSDVAQIALSMPLTKVREMRAEVLSYYNSVLRPSTIGRQLVERQPSTLFVNDEKGSVRRYLPPAGVAVGTETRDAVITRDETTL